MLMIYEKPFYVCNFILLIFLYSIYCLAAESSLNPGETDRLRKISGSQTDKTARFLACNIEQANNKRDALN